MVRHVDISEGLTLVGLTADVIVSPSPSSGYMDGGIDGATLDASI